jgi:NADH-quinone oxidoreductase subunit M
MLAWTIYLSFAGALVEALLPKGKAALARWLALAVAVAGLALAAAGFAAGMGHGRVTIVDAAWVPSMGIHFLLAADGISLVLVLLTGLAAVAGVLFSWNVEMRTNEFFAFYLALIGGVYGVFLSFDLFLLFVFYEIAIVPKYFLIAIWGSTRREYGAMKLALYSFVGSAMVLIGLLAAYATSGSHSTGLVALAHAGLPVSFQMWAFPLVFTGFAILAGMWPFHTWAPTGHVAAPTAASMLLAGVGILGRRHRLVARRVCGAGGSGHCVWRAGGAGADRLQICDRLLQREPHGVCAAGAGDAEPDWRDRRGAADVFARRDCGTVVRHCRAHRV